MPGRWMVDHPLVDALLLACGGHNTFELASNRLSPRFRRYNITSARLLKIVSVVTVIFTVLTILTIIIVLLTAVFVLMDDFSDFHLSAPSSSSMEYGIILSL